MQQRFLQKSHHQYPEVSFGTFHSVFYHILQREAAPAPQLVSAAFQIGLLRRLWEDVHGNAPTKDEIRALGSAISKAKSNPDAKYTLPLLTEQEFKLIRQRYDSQLRERGLLDFDDMILECGRLLRRKREVLRRWQQRFPWILVDEFQDINGSQYEILRLLAGESANLFVVGDDDQSIYGFRGAAPGIMRRFRTDHPDCRCIQLRHNYRCSQRITSLSQKVICQNHDRLPKEVKAMREEGRKVEKMGFLSPEEEYAFLIRELKGKPKEELLQTVIIVRTHLQGRRIYEALAKAKIPCAQESLYKQADTGSLLFYETVAAYIRFSIDLGRGAVKRKDLYLIMNRPERYLPRSIASGETVTRQQMQEAVRNAPASASALAGLLSCCDSMGRMRPAYALSYLRKTTSLESWMNTKGISPAEAAALFDRQKEKARSMQRQQELLNYLQAQIQACYNRQESKAIPAAQKADQGVHILTMHGAKGLEFDTVFLPDLNEGILPSRQADTPAMIEEERRLFYVAITRARDRLFLLYVTGTKLQPVPVSRFLVSLL